jgi:hypothetical protein
MLREVQQNGDDELSAINLRRFTTLDHCNGAYHKKNPDRCNWAGFTNKNLAFKLGNCGSN